MIAKLIAFLCRCVLVAACGVVLYGVALLAVRLPAVGLAVLAILAVWRFRRRGGSSWSHGTATTSSLADIDRRRMFANKGLMLCRCLPEKPPRMAAIRGLLSLRVGSESACRMFLAAFFGRRWSGGRIIRLRKHVHLATYGPAGSGKGVGVLVPNLLSYPGNCVVTDPKGELFELTAKHRHTKFGHKIIRLDPFGVCGPGGDTLNPMAGIDAKSDDLLDACRELAGMIIVRSGQEKDPHWNDSAELVLTAFIAYICGCEPDRSQRHLGTVRSLAASRAVFAKAIEVMQQHDDCQGVIKRLGGLLTWFDGEELGSVLTTFQRHTAVFDSPGIARHLAASSFDPMILRRGKATVYLILPANRLASHASLQRLWVGSIMRTITAGKPTEKNPVLWLLDEMAHIGHLQAVEDAVTLMRGMGMRLWFFFQSVEQLKSCFGDKAATVQDNIGTEQFFGVKSLDTAEYISKRIGETTITVHSDGDTDSTSMPSGGGQSGGGSSRSTGSSRNRSDIARRIFKTEEVLTLPKGVNLVFHENMPVILGEQIRYYDAPEFKGGGIGRQKGLSVAAGILAMLTLSAGVVLAGFAASLPPELVSPGGYRGRGLTPAARRAAGSLPYGDFAPSRPARQIPARQRQPRAFSFPDLSGFSNPIW